MGRTHACECLPRALAPHGWRRRRNTALVARVEIVPPVIARRPPVTLTAALDSSDTLRSRHPADTTDASTFDAGAELDRQVERLTSLGYGDLTGLGDQGLRSAVEPLRETVVARTAHLQDRQPSAVPFVLVVAPRLAPPLHTMPLITRGTRAPKPGFVSPDLQDVDRFVPIEGVDVPDVDVYLLLDVHRGDEYLGQRPDEALPQITALGRTPLTVAEGIALVTLFGQVLEKNRCFMLLGSRCGDRRVPALWISGGSARDGGTARRGAAKLGWCWAGNHHTWLGHASAAQRVG
jgi:hypothetical protein